MTFADQCDNETSADDSAQSLRYGYIARVRVTIVGCSGGVNCTYIPGDWFSHLVVMNLMILYV